MINYDYVKSSFDELINSFRLPAWRDRIAKEDENYIKKLVFCLKNAQKVENFEKIYNFVAKEDKCIDLVNDTAYFSKGRKGIEFGRYFYSRYDKLSPEDGYQLKYYIRWLERLQNDQNDVEIEC